MKENLLISLCLSMLGIVAAGPSAAAQDDLCEEIQCREYNHVRHHNLWSESSNAVGIRQDTSVAKVSYAELYGGYTGGGYHESFESSSCWNVGAQAHSIVHLKKFSLQGSFRFRHAQGKDMCGSMMTLPGYYPVDVLEFTPGTKDRQTYAFAGAISSDIASGWKLGGGVSFEAMNTSKRKDLRYTDFYLDFKVSPGVIYSGKDWSVGLNYLFQRTSEAVNPEQIGKSAGEIYYAFLNKGLWRGAYEEWQGGGIHLKDTGLQGFPIQENTHGGSLQFSYRNFYVDASYNYGRAKAGEKDCKWFDIPSHKVELNLRGKRENNGYLHLFGLQAFYSAARTGEYVQEKITKGGVTEVKTLACTSRFFSRACGLAPKYELMSERFELSVEAEFGQRWDESFQLCPYVYKEKSLEASVHAATIVHVWKFDIGALVGCRFGAKEESRADIAPAGSIPEPYYLSYYDNLETDYLTTPAVRCGLSLKYNIWKGIYLEALGRYAHAFGLKYINGADRGTATLSFGYSF